MAFYFDIINLSKSGFTSAHIAENPGAFLQAVLTYRDKFATKSSKQDKYYAIQIQDLTKIDPELTKDKRIILTMPKEKVDLVTCNGGFQWNSNILQEQEAHKLILEELILALNVLNKNGCMICKIFECFTDITNQLIAFVAQLFENLYIAKPLTSRLASSEKYLICMNFQDPKDLSKKLNSLTNALDQIKKSKDVYVSNLFTGYTSDKINPDYLTNVLIANTRMANLQFMRINEEIDCVK